MTPKWVFATWLRRAGVSFDLLDLRVDLARIGLGRGMISDRIVADMLYDSKWEKKSETQDVYAISTLKAWLERYNPATDYNFHHADNCLLARYFKAHGITDRDVWYALSPSTRMPEEFYNAARGEPWTYGDALERLNDCVHEDCACA